jgi:hypothetical protein
MDYLLRLGIFRQREKMKRKPTIEERRLKDLKKEITYEIDKLIIEDLRATQEKNKADTKTNQEE